jgi:hypothetical protein
MTSTRTLIAVRVWQRAADRISVIDLDMTDFLHAQYGIAGRSLRSGHYDSPSHSTIRTRPASASEIRYAVMMGLAVGEENARHDRLGDHFGREPYPLAGAACGAGFRRAAYRHFRACRLKGSDGDTLTTPGATVGV